MLRVFPAVLALALALVACSSAPPPEPVVPSEPPKAVNQRTGDSSDPGTPTTAPEPPADDAAEPTPLAEPDEPEALAEADDGAKGGVACTATDTNGPESGGTRTDTCPEGQFCFCDRAGGYSCAGTCHRFAGGTPKGK